MFVGDRQVWAAISVVLFVGCAERAKPGPAAASAPAPVAASAEKAGGGAPAVDAGGGAQQGAAAHLVIAPLKLVNANGEAVVLDAEGKLTKGDGTLVGVLGRDGRLVGADGQVKAQLTADGDVLVAGGRRLPLHLDESGALQVERGNERLEFDHQGLLKGGNPNAPKVRVEGFSEASRRTAMFLLVLAAFPTR